MTHPNTDSRELKEIERILDFFDDPEVIAAEILAYTANKQKELLESVEQETEALKKLPHTDEAGSEYKYEGYIKALNHVGKAIKNKKENL